MTALKPKTKRKYLKKSVRYMLQYTIYSVIMSMLYTIHGYLCCVEIEGVERALAKSICIYFIK